MSPFVLCLLALLAAPAVSGAAAAAGTPVEKVVELLVELKGRITTDAKENERLHAKYACWCEGVLKRKAAALTQAELKIREGSQLILKYRALVAKVPIREKALNTDISDDTEAIDEMTLIRKKENAQYAAESGDLMQALAALERAIVVLRDATTPALLQDASASRAAWRRAVSGVKAAVDAMPSSAVVSPERASQLTAFLQGASDASASGAAAEGSPQSATVQGILKDMYDTFSADLEGMTAEEASRNKQYEDVAAIKYKLKGEEEAQVVVVQDKGADHEVMLADQQAAYEDWQAVKKADIVVFDETKEACQAKHEEYLMRKAHEEDELLGVEEAIKILTSDEARELFAKSVKPGMERTMLLQVGSDGSEVMTAQVAVSKAYRALKALAKRTHNLRLASLAATVRVDGMGSFDKVVQAIDGMIQVLMEEAQGDVAERDHCKEEYQLVASGVTQLRWEAEKSLAQIHKLESLIESREDDKIETEAQIGTAEEDIQAMEATRNEEHQAFVAAKSNEEMAIELLEAAKAALMSYFETAKIPVGPLQASINDAFLAKASGPPRSAGAASEAALEREIVKLRDATKPVLLQEASAGGAASRRAVSGVKEPEFVISEDQAPDASFSDRASHKTAGKGIVSILTMIVEDLRAEIAAGAKDEEAAQLQFEADLKGQMQLVAELKERKISVADVIAKRKEEWTQEHMLHDDTQDSVAELGEHRKTISTDCDWILSAFEERRAKRQVELDALGEAKAYLAGAEPPAMLQTQMRPHVGRSDGQRRQ